MVEGDTVNDRKSRPALVLGGGGAFGSVQAAYVKAAHEMGFRPQVVVGTSVGSLNGAWVAMYPDDPGGLLDVWRGLHRVRVLHPNPLRMLARVVRRGGGLYSNEIVPRLIGDHIGEMRFDDTRLPLSVIATNLSEGRKAVFNAGPLAPAILASTSIPGIFDPVEIGGQLYVDGCVTASVDLVTAMTMGATEILAIDLTPSTLQGSCRPRTALGVLRRSFGVLSHATTDAMQAVVEQHLPVQVVRPKLDALSPWRIHVDEAELERALAEARETLRSVLDTDGRVIRREPATGTVIPANPATGRWFAPGRWRHRLHTSEQPAG